MASIYTQINMVDRMSSPLNNIISAVQQMTNQLSNVDNAINQGFDTGAIEAARQSIGMANTQMEEIQESIRQAAQRQDNLNNEVNQGQSAMDGLAKKALGMVAAYASIQSIGKVMDLSDKMAQTDARLSLIVDDGGSVDELQQKIYAVAQNTRAPFLETADMVSKLGMQASKAFTSNDELLAFAEQLNKTLVVAGTEAQGVDSVMLQLTQSMAAGKLQGEELNALLDNAAPLVQNIQRYLEEVQGFSPETTDNIKQLASDGVLTAEVIKNAMFYAADETNAKFNAMPVTFAQAWQGIQDDLLMTFQPIIETIAQGAGWIHDNWSTIEPVFWGLTAAVAAYALITGISAAATWLSVAANQALIVTMLSNPILWIAILIGFLVAKLYQWVQSVGGVKIAWMIAMNAIKTAGDWAWIGIMTGVNWVMNSFNKFQLTVMTVSTAIQNFMGDMKAGVLMTLENMVNGAIGIINDFIAVLNKIPGVSIEAVAQVSFGTTAELENQANKAARNAELTDYANDVAAKISARDMALNQMKSDAIAATAERQADIDAAQIQAAAKQQSSMYDGFDAMASNLGDIASNTGDIKDSVTTSEEDLKYMLDLASQEAINRYTTAEIKVDMGGITQNISKDTDVDGIISYMVEGVNEAIEKTAAGVHQ